MLLLSRRQRFALLGRVRGPGPSKICSVIVPDLPRHIKSALERATKSEQRAAMLWLREQIGVHPLERKFGAPAEVILEAIDRASDLSQRGVLGLIAEASFKVNVLGQLDAWVDEPVVGDAPFDFQISNGKRVVRIQVKRQRLVRQQPMRFRAGSELYAAETQRSRKGTDSRTGADTRPYRFGEFDILAVCMQPSTADWTCFRFTPQRWLLPRPERSECLRVIQPVSLEENNDWTGELTQCLEWLDGGAEKQVGMG